MFSDAVDTDTKPEGRGKRHPKKSKRWEVVECQDPLMKHTWLSCIDGKSLLKAGDFYPDYTVIWIPHENRKVTVKGRQIFDDNGEPIELM